MDILYLLIPLAVVLMVVAVAGLMWAIRSGQFEDMEGPAHRILMDDDDPRIPARREPADEDNGGQEASPARTRTTTGGDGVGGADRDPPA